MFEQLHTGEIYDPVTPELAAFQQSCLELLHTFNQIPPSQMDRRNALMHQMLADCGEGCYIEPPFYANFAGRHVHFGDYVYANFNLTCVDDTHIYVGDHTMFGPGVQLVTATHPIDPALREKGLQYNKPIRIGRNCWFGAGAIVLPGVTIGDNVVVGAGSIVTKDLPDNVVAVGNPCRILRKIEPETHAEFTGSSHEAERTVI